MRRKVTINVDEDWLKLIDSTRGLIPRSRYIEMIARDLGSRIAPAEDERSPEPQSEEPSISTMVNLNEAEWEAEPKAENGSAPGLEEAIIAEGSYDVVRNGKTARYVPPRPRTSKPPLQRPIIQKR